MQDMTSNSALSSRESSAFGVGHGVPAKQPMPIEERSVLEQLLHALNQPLTGLQCSMEVALATPRTAEQYVRTLQDGVELSGRLRALVGAIREVVTGRELVVAKGSGKQNAADSKETFLLQPLVQEIVEDLAPVAQATNVRLVADLPLVPSRVGAKRAGVSSAIFRILESVLSLAEPGSAVGVEIGAESAEICIRIHWTTAEPSGSLSLPEVGLLVAQAALEQAGARWELRRREKSQTVTVWLPEIRA